MNKGILMTLIFTLAVISTGCELPTQTIIVKFEDLKSDLFTMEKTLQSGEWYKVEEDVDGNMIIHLYSMKEMNNTPYALGAYQIAQASSSSESTRSVAASDALDLRAIDITPVIRDIMVRRQSRYSKINELKKTLIIGENNEGLVEPSPGIDKKTFSEETIELIENENKDRINLLKEILRQKGYENGLLPKLQKEFAKVQYEMTPVGLWIQTKDGEWVKKTR